jgi:GNAT superfamily N-acetyltransferase
VALLSPSKTEKGGLKVHGVCVAEGMRGCGYGTLLMESLPALVPPTTSSLELCVDEGTRETARLRAWYERLGYSWMGSTGEGEGRMLRVLVAGEQAWSDL